MNIMELGSLGEFVSSIAVVLTLAYLAVQTRLNFLSCAGGLVRRPRLSYPLLPCADSL